MSEPAERELPGDVPYVRRWTLRLTLLLAVAALSALVGERFRWAMSAGPFAWFGLASATVALVSVAARLERRTRGVTDTTTTGVLLIPIPTAAIASAPEFLTVWLVLMSGFYLELGAHQHLAFRRLERRLAALTERA